MSGIPFRMSTPGYPPEMTKPMEEELTRLGVEALHTAEAVEEVIGAKQGTVLVVVNSVCGCAAGGARPGVAMSLTHAKKPEKMVTVFAGVDREAANRAREYFTGYRPTSPMIGLLKDGEVKLMLERHHIEGQMPDAIANVLKVAFDKFC
jgi:putative YphP/YqiW family bacilliredoxin